MKTILAPKTPKILQLANWILDPVDYLEKTAQKYPDLFKAEVIVSADNVFFVSNPKILQQILTNDRKQFVASAEGNRILGTLIGDYSVMMLDGDRHKQRRQLLMPSFHAQQISNYANTITRITKEVMDQAPVDEVIEARSLTQSITLKVIMEAVFGLSQGERYDRLKALLTSLLEVFRVPAKVVFLLFPILQKDLGKWSPWGNFLALKQEIGDLIYAEINERRHLPPGNDILSLLMSAQDAQGNHLRDEELRDELITLLFAGHETTATALAWAIYWTHQLPDVKAKILLELSNLEHWDPLEIARLPYLNAVCNETLRIYPVAMLTFPRKVQTDSEIDGYFFPANSSVLGLYLPNPSPQGYLPRFRYF